MIDLQFPCSTCTYWRHDPALVKNTDASTLKAVTDSANDSGIVTAARHGYCLGEPRVTAMLQVQGPIRGSAPQMAQQPVYKLSAENETCHLHPDRRAHELRQLAVFAVGAWKHSLEYKPGVIADETGAGFSRPPTFTEARQYDPSVKAGEPVPGILPGVESVEPATPAPAAAKQMIRLPLGARVTKGIHFILHGSSKWNVARRIWKSFRFVVTGK